MLVVDGIKIQVIRKNIKNLYFRVYAKDGQTRVFVPQNISDADLQSAVISKLNWIKSKQTKFQNLPCQSTNKFINGECHYFFGKAYYLQIIEHTGKHKVVLKPPDQLQLFLNSGTSTDNKNKSLDTWYRVQLKQHIIELLDKWQPIIGKKVSDFGVKKMRTRWGSCNVVAKRIWLNLDLAQKPPECLEYVLVHELVHLHERKHNINFKNLMDKFLPQWRLTKNMLNQNREK